MGFVSKRNAKVRNRRQKFLKVGQKLRNRRDRKRGLHDSEEELVGYKKSSDSSEKREHERETCVTLTNGREWQDNLCYCILNLQYVKRHYVAGYLLV